MAAKGPEQTWKGVMGNSNSHELLGVNIDARARCIEEAFKTASPHMPSCGNAPSDYKCERYNVQGDVHIER